MIADSWRELTDSDTPRVREFSCVRAGRRGLLAPEWQADVQSEFRAMAAHGLGSLPPKLNSALIGGFLKDDLAALVELEYDSTLPSTMITGMARSIRFSGCGVGDEILAECERRVKYADGVPRTEVMTAYVDYRNGPSIRLFQRAGYEVVKNSGQCHFFAKVLR